MDLVDGGLDKSGFKCTLQNYASAKLRVQMEAIQNGYNTFSAMLMDILFTFFPFTFNFYIYILLIRATKITSGYSEYPDQINFIKLLSFCVALDAIYLHSYLLF